MSHFLKTKAFSRFPKTIDKIIEKSSQINVKFVNFQIPVLVNYVFFSLLFYFLFTLDVSFALLTVFNIHIMTVIITWPDSLVKKAMKSLSDERIGCAAIRPKKLWSPRHRRSMKTPPYRSVLVKGCFRGRGWKTKIS